MARILHISLSPTIGWPERQMSLLLPRLVEQGHDLQVCTSLSENDASCPLPIEPLVLSGQPGLDVRKLRMLRDLLRRLEPDLVHLWLNGRATNERLLPLLQREILAGW